MLKELIIACQSYYQAHLLIRQQRLWIWIIVPGIVYCALLILGMYFFGKTSSAFIGWLGLETGLKGWLDKMQSGLLGFLFTLAALILWLIQMLFYFSLFKYIVLIAGSPVFAFLSEKTEAIVDGRRYAFSWLQLSSDIFRGVRIACRNAFWQSVYTVAFLLLSIVPVIGWITPVMALGNECFFYGFSMADYHCHRRRMSLPESIYYVNHHRGLATGNGMVFYLMHLVPIIGWVLAPAYAVIAATLSMQEEGKISN